MSCSSEFIRPWTSMLVFDYTRLCDTCGGTTRMVAVDT